MTKSLKISGKSKKGMMIGKIPIPEENVKFIVNNLGIERTLRNADIDEVVRCIDVNDRLRRIDVEELVQNLGDEDIQKLQRLLNQKNK